MTTTTRGEGPLRLILLSLCFAVSGVAALVFQTAWTRQFALVFGTSELAVATVLAAYMGGLALGAHLVHRWLPRVRRPVFTYAVLEAAIGSSAVVLVPLLLAASSALLVTLFGDQPAPPSSDRVGISVFYLASALVALAVPTVLMGATLPLLARHAVHTDDEIGRRIGLLYAANTAGAVAGALLGAFWLLPNLGLRATVWSGAALNGVVFVLASGLARRAPLPNAEHIPDDTVAPRSVHWILPLMACSGAVSFVLEVLWTRMLGHIVGSSIYAFGVMVASFLAGIALGGAVAAWIARDRRTAVFGFAASQVAIALAGAVAYIVLERMLPERSGLLPNVTFGASLLVPITFFIGMTYPFAVRILAEHSRDAAAASARVYAWNTVGAIVGALAGGFWIIPALSYEGTVHATTIASAALAALALWLLLPGFRVIAIAASVVALVAAFAFNPEAPRRLLVKSPLNVPSHGELLYSAVGRSASVVLLEQDGMLALRTNGLPEALMDMTGTAPRFSGEYWLSPLAVLARPDTRDMLIVGYGGGVVVEGVPPSVRSIDVIELEPKVIEANRFSSHLRRRDPLSDPRLRVIENDARGAMRLTSKRYDAIVSQPSHPWTAGASHLYTREFMLLAREHLTEGGVFVQWMNVGFLDERLLRSLAATLLDVFTEARLYRPDPNTLVFLASMQPMEIERDLARTGLPLAYSPGHYARFGINAVEDLAVALMADTPSARALAGDAELITDDVNRMATSSVFELGRGLSADATGRILAAYDPLTDATSPFREAIANRIDAPYMARRIAGHAASDPSARDRLARFGNTFGDTAQRAYVEGISLLSMSKGPEAREHFRRALARFPNDDALRFETLRPYLGPLARGTAPADIAEIARSFSAGDAVLTAGRANARRDWQQLADLDHELAKVPWTTPWSMDAIQLRADWRTRVTSPEARKALGDEALALIDRAIVVQPTVPLFGLRARAGVATERPDVAVESIWSFALGTAANAQGRPPEARAEARATLNALVAVLDDPRTRTSKPNARYDEVRKKVIETAATLN